MPIVFKKSNIKLSHIIAFVLLTIILIFILYFYYFRKPGQIIQSGEPVITQLKELKRYETSSFTVEQIIEAGKEGNRFQEILFGDRILLIAHGEVIAGFDFSTLTNENIEIDNNIVRLTLPPPIILLTRLDNEKTRVYDRDQGFLTQGDKDLESEARRSAEATIRQAACDGGILEQASENAKRQLSTLIKALGYSSVVIEIPRGSC